MVSEEIMGSTLFGYHGRMKWGACMFSLNELRLVLNDLVKWAFRVFFFFWQSPRLGFKKYVYKVFLVDT